MSGEAGGVVLGALVVVALAPYVLAAGAAAAVGYGIYKGSVAAGKQYQKKKEEEEKKKQAFINECSAELQSTYQQMFSISASQQKQFEDFKAGLDAELSEMGSQLEALAKSSSDVSFLQKKIDEAHAQLTATLKAKYSETGSAIVKESKAKLSECTATLESQLKAKNSLAVWASKTEQHMVMQKALASDALSNAKASIEALRVLADGNADISFKNKCIALENQLKKAQRSFDAQSYQMAFSAANTIITQCAVLTSEQLVNEAEIDLMTAHVLTLLEACYAEMEKNRFVEFENQKTGRIHKADLNQFSQGKYKGVMRKIRKEIEHITSSPQTLFTLEQALNRAENELIPEAQHWTETARRIMQKYFERDAALKAIAEYMEKQNYKVNWMAAAGKDPSQELVVNFTGPYNDETISLVLSSDATAGDVTQMALEVYSYSNGDPISEQERQRFRDLVTEALKEAGFVGELSCTGKLNESAENNDFRSREETQQKQTNALS